MRDARQQRELRRAVQQPELSSRIYCIGSLRAPILAISLLLHADHFLRAPPNLLMLGTLGRERGLDWSPSGPAMSRVQASRGDRQLCGLVSDVPCTPCDQYLHFPCSSKRNCPPGRAGEPSEHSMNASFNTSLQSRLPYRRKTTASITVGASPGG